MSCDNSRKVRYLSDISSVSQLREARRELDLRTWYTERRLSEDVRDTFSLDGLLSMFAPSGSTSGRMMGSVGTGIAAARGVFNAVRNIIARRRGGGCDCGC